MIIPKAPTNPNRYLRPFCVFRSARAALKALLGSYKVSEGDLVLLPSYIGWSPREGSGVFDPIAERGLCCSFYRLDAQLNIDIVHFEHVLHRRPPRVVLLVHYFGRVDAQAARAAQLAKRAGAIVVEDSAHAMLTNLVGGAAGDLGDATIFSLHKLLPVTMGGLLVMNALPDESCGSALVAGSEYHRLPWDFDLRAIAERRRANASAIRELLSDAGDDIQPLWSVWPDASIPQTFPVLIKRASRDSVYHRLNEDGYGVVTLYHTLIGAIAEREFPESHHVAQRILNLPVHQDVEVDTLVGLIHQLKETVVISGRHA
jgi:dTDP-4-amino-4,6-dideoxygalactose transaminase